MSQPIEDMFEDKARAGDGQFAIAYALMQIAREQKNVAYQIGRLGLGDAASNWGALELLSKSLSDGLDRVAGSVDGLSD